ncbi:hypothetical protein [Blastomonas aquatica]|uniref:hypothetical protein n=1 Tax=Blastomonas aquatica TaxID=1510276 RepID=UPI00166CE1C3|nr:hypothetical protein [Blastomonas aquatica]
MRKVSSGVASRAAGKSDKPKKSARGLATPLQKFRALFKLLAMDWSEIGLWAGALVLIAAFFMLPRWFSFRHRAIAGTILFPLGWAGVFSGIAVGNRPFMQSEAVAYTWLGISCLAIVLAITLLVPVFFEWLRKRRKPKRTTESWRGGHLKR